MEGVTLQAWVASLHPRDRPFQCSVADSSRTGSAGLLGLGKGTLQKSLGPLGRSNVGTMIYQ